jgi:hypothetical protein
MRYPEKLLIRLPAGTRHRIEGAALPGETLAQTQRRIVLAGIDAVSNNPFQKPLRTLSKNARKIESGI